MLGTSTSRSANCAVPTACCMHVHAATAVAMLDGAVTQTTQKYNNTILTLIEQLALAHDTGKRYDLGLNAE